MASAASPVVSQPMPAYRQDPITSVVSSSAWSSLSTSAGWPVVWCRLMVVAAGVVASDLAKPAEGGGVAVGLGREVAAEPEHVDIPAPARVGASHAAQGSQDGAPGQLAHGASEPRQMPAAGLLVGGQVAGGFGGVLGDVGSDSLGVQLAAVGVPVRGAGDGAGVQLRAEPEPPSHVVAVDGWGVVPDGGRGRDLTSPASAALSRSTAGGG